MGATAVSAPRPPGPEQFDPAAYRQDPWKYYDWFRAHRPVSWSEPGRCFFVHSHALVDEVLRGPDFTVENLFRRSRQVLGPTLVDSDGEDHTRLRPFVNQDLTGRRVRDLIEHVVRPVAEDLATGLARRGQADFVADYAMELPFRVAVELVGLDQADRARLARLMRPVIAYLDRVDAPLSTAFAAREELEAHVREVRTARGCPARGGLLGRTTPRAPEGIGEDEVVRTVALLLAAGTETTVCTLSNALLCLLRFPEQEAALRAGTLPVADFVREVLRWEPPLHFTLRYAVRDTELGSVPIPRGAAVQVNFAAANRDPEVFADPDAFVPRRPERAGLSFGRGRHSCPGSRLATAEVEIALEALLGASSRIRCTEVELPPVRGVTFRRCQELPLSLDTT
ncbi:cytochrome P450 [Streptomyces adelaidensis]|uniref:cytochrome P450 n=1 Tax=Streptomyces adelaidensis TaxID=2796465 RepID=UPI001902DC65|nr:cytochrome P450 [Streptomyces adelaidensis]